MTIRLSGNPARATQLATRLAAADATSAAPRGRHRPVRLDVDPVAVQRVLAGTMHHSHLSWPELADVLHRLDRVDLTDHDTDAILRARPGFASSMRSRCKLGRRLHPAPQPTRGAGSLRRTA